MLPVVAHEKLVNLFYFYLDGHIQEGMCCCSGLYQLIRTFHDLERQQAHAFGCQLASLGNRVVITISESQYKIWADFRWTEGALQNTLFNSEPFAIEDQQSMAALLPG